VASSRRSLRTKRNNYAKDKEIRVMRMRKVLVAIAVAALVQGIGWFWAQNSATPPDVEDLLESVSFNPVAPGEDPRKNDLRISQIDRDLELVAQYAKSIRLYNSTGGAEMIPVMAARHGVNVTVGAWLDPAPLNETAKDKERREARNKRELDTAVQLTRDNRNVKAVVVGNEVLLRAEVNSQEDQERAVDELTKAIKYVKKRVKVPVTTGEVWDRWLKHPKLVKEVDFIAAHILPYWEGVPADQAMADAWGKYDRLRRAFPGKRIVIAEFGWPSQGYNFKAAEVSPVIQAQIVRQFLAEARARGAEYNIVEAFDQPWKASLASAEPYWGMFDANRNLKFPLFGPVEGTSHQTQAMVGAAVAALIAVLGLWGRRVMLAEAVVYALAAAGMGAGIAAAGAYPFQNYMNVGAWIMWSTGFALMLVLCIITMAKMREIAGVLFGERPKRLIGVQSAAAPTGYTPKVSIHIPAYREPAEMLKQTLDSCAALDYPNFEVVLVINNTPEEHYWGPVEAHCRALGDRFKFLNIPKLSGFKAGALNAALDATADDAEIIAVIDADYVVHKDWLKDLAPYFADGRVGLVQAPQDHRDGQQSLLKTMMNSEYAGFFDIGMVQRNEDNAIVTHGTMCMVRRSALAQVGGWKHDTIVEDTELGLRLFEAGWLAHYTNKRYGWGLLPDTFKAFKTQRHRWAYGAVQIIKKHWRHMLPSSRTLSPAQKRGFVAGWFFWLSDAMGALAAAMALLWAPVVLFVGVLIPTVALSVPILLAFAINVLHCVLLYRNRVRETGPRIFGAAVAAMSLQWTVAKAVFEGFVKDGLPFMRTDKGGNAKKKTKDDSAKWEGRFGVALALAALAVWLLNRYGLHAGVVQMVDGAIEGVNQALASDSLLRRIALAPLEQWLGVKIALNKMAIIPGSFRRPQDILEQNVFALTLAVQAVPFLATAAMRVVERSAEWRRVWAAKPVTGEAGATAAATVTA